MWGGAAERRGGQAMTLYLENETDFEFPFSIEDTARLVCEAVLEKEQCPYEAQVNVVLTDNEGIRELNKTYRGIDSETDVLSFPNVDFEARGIFEIPKEREMDYFDPDTGELLLGDIMISVEKVFSQAQSFGHSVKREFAFLIAHSMLHLCGYDHMDEDERKEMEDRQDEILNRVHITRE